MMTYWLLSGDGETPVPTTDALKWARWFQVADRVVQQDWMPELTDKSGVSTIFIGLDYNWGTGRPLLWESMVFGTPLDGACRRYASRAEAVAGHALLLAAVRQAMAMEAGPWDHNGECLHCDGLGEHLPGCPYRDADAGSTGGSTEPEPP